MDKQVVHGNHGLKDRKYGGGTCDQSYSKVSFICIVLHVSRDSDDQVRNQMYASIGTRSLVLFHAVFRDRWRLGCRWGDQSMTCRKGGKTNRCSVQFILGNR